MVRCNITAVPESFEHCNPRRIALENLMPLSESAARQAIHDRHVHCAGLRREDGLWDIEGHIRDTKTYSFETGS